MFCDKKVTAIIMAAGKGSRMNASLPKQFLALHDKTILEHAVKPFEESSYVDEILVVAGEGFEKLCADKCSGFSKVKRIVTGGKERQDSVNNGIKQVDEGYVLIHDGARPYVSGCIIEGVLQGVQRCGAAVPCVPVKDTVRKLEPPGRLPADMSEAPDFSEPPGVSGLKTESKTIDRSLLFNVQTPQGFDIALIKEAFKKAYEDGFYATDDAGLVDRLGKPVAITEGSYSNIKITTKEDLPVDIRIGSGYDVHRLVPERRLVLCGVEIPFEKGLLGHSDADVALHALMDAMLGAAALGDIGRHFPDSDMKYKDISSMRLLKEVKDLIKKQGFALNNADVTIMAQRPKLMPHIEQMRKNIADILEKDISCINVKATTTEKLGFVGREEGIAAEAVCILSKF